MTCATLPNCDRCGRFVSPSTPGASWSHTYTHLTLNDVVWRCAKCTEKHGERQTNIVAPGYAGIVGREMEGKT